MLALEKAERGTSVKQLRTVVSVPPETPPLALCAVMLLPIFTSDPATSLSVWTPTNDKTSEGTESNPPQGIIVAPVLDAM